MKKYSRWYHHTVESDIRVRFPKIRVEDNALEIVVPKRPLCIYKEDDYLYLLFVDARIGESTILKYTIEGVLEDTVKHLFSSLMTKWELTKTFNQYSDKSIFNMTLNTVNKLGELERLC